MKTANENFELLSKLLSEKNSLNSEYNELYEEIFSLVSQDFSAKLNKSAYPQKAAIISKIKDVLSGVEVLTQFPELVGKTIVGIMGTKGKENDVLLDKISCQKGMKLYSLSNNVPVIIHNAYDEEDIRAVNLLESPISITPQEFKDANQELYKKRIDIRQFLCGFSVSTNIPYANIAYIYFPAYALKSREYYHSLFNLTDVVLLPVDSTSDWQDTLKYVENYKGNIATHLFADKEDFASIERIVKEIYVENRGRKAGINIHKNISEFDKLMQAMDCIRNNVAIAERILEILSGYRLYEVQRIDKLQNTIESFNKDILNIESEETADSARKFREELTNSLESSKFFFSKYNTVENKLMDLVCQFENSLYKASQGSIEKLKYNNVLYHGQFEETCSNLVMNLIQSGDFNLARKYIGKLDSRKYRYSYIFELYMDRKMNRTPSYKNMQDLKKESSSEDIVLKAKVRFGNSIGFSIEEMAEFASCITNPLDGYENYILGEYYSKTDKSRAKIFYDKSFKSGYLEAGNKLVQYLGKNDYWELEKLANMLIPEANYLYGLVCLENNKYARGITNLKIAATFEHLKAINKLADIEYLNAVRNCANPDGKTERATNIALELYRYILSRDPENIYAIENLGHIYYWKKEYRKSRELLEKCSSKEALFLCGRMYQYGNGVAKDIYKARDLFDSAATQGHTRANVEYHKVLGWIDSSNAKNAYNKRRDYSTTSSYSHESSSGGLCFLTTATCLALDKEDDCEELLEFKRYRDEHLVYDENGAGLIREYYRIAPFILQEIYKEPSPNIIFKRLYDEYISVGYDHLKKNDYVNAKETYINMVKNLCEKYNVEISLKQ